MNSSQSRMARAALGWSIKRLVNETGVHRNTILKVETGSQVRQTIINLLRLTYEAAGVEFVDDHTVRYEQKNEAA